MSLLQDLSNLDLSAIINAQASISASSDGLRVSLEGGAALSALGDLGKAIQAIESGIDKPEDLLRPLLEQVLQLAEPLKEEIELAPWFEEVKQGTEILLEVINAINGNPSSFAEFITGASSTDLVQKASNLVSEYSPVSLEGASQFQSLIDQVEGNMPTDPAALADLAISILQPFEGRVFAELRTELDQVIASLDEIQLPNTRVSGLQTGLQAVISAANTGDAEQLNLALGNLQTLRSNTIIAVRNDMAQISRLIGNLPIQSLFEPINDVGAALQTAEDGVLTFLNRWRSEIALANGFLEQADFSEVGNILDTGLDHLEQAAIDLFVKPIDDAVARLKAWLRELLAHLRLAEYRNQISDFFASVTTGIESANLDAAAEQAKTFLNDIEQAVSGDLQNSVQSGLGELKTEMDGFIGGVIDSLEVISDGINDVTAQATAVLQQLLDVLATFQQTLDQITAMVDQLGIEAATDQVIDTLSSLRTAAEQVLSDVALPDVMRPAIEQLIKEVESLDLDEVFAPAFEVADIDLSIPDEVTQGLEQAAEAIKNLIPDELIDEINGQISELLDVIREFDPSVLLSGVTDVISQATSALRELDPRAVVNDIRGPYQEVLNLLDEIHPNKLLAPVIEQWDQLLGEVNIQSPEAAIGSVTSSINTAGEQLARQAVAPIEKVAPAGMLEMPAQDQTSSNDSTLEPEDILPVKPGDVIRMFAYLPTQLRAFIQEMDQQAAQGFISHLDGLGRGLATDLTSLNGKISSLEDQIILSWDEMLSPLSALQFDAQLAIEANFSVADIELEASLAALAVVRPGSLRQELNQTLENTLTDIRKLSLALTNGAGNSLHYASDKLKANPIFALTHDLDDFLAALDFEPMAQELDQLIETVLRRAPEAIDEIEDTLLALASRFEKILRELNPAAQAQKFITVTEVLEEQINLLDPRRLAAELGEIHAVIKRVFLAYDPAVFAQEIFEIVDALANTITALDPAVLLGDLADFDGLIARIDAASPANALSGIDASLEELGNELQNLNPTDMLEAINELPDRIVEAVARAIEALKAEIIALLEAIKYASANASVSVEVSASTG